jgi:DNA polymerase alpha subunit B
MYVIEPDDLRFKLEAINYKPSVTLSKFAPITMDTLSAVKAQIQQSLAKQNAARLNVNLKTRGTAQIDRSRIPASMNRNQARMPTLSSSSSIKQEFAEPSLAGFTRSSVRSNVTFVGPSMDLEERKKRACESSYPSQIVHEC